MVGQAVGLVDPEFCLHPWVHRLGIQRLPFPPYRMYLLTCVVCSGTITTGTVRERRRTKGSHLTPSPGRFNQAIEP